MTLSVLIPVYGVEKYIERCARSLFGQTLEDIEYVFVDDCTPDRSMEILQRVLEDYPHRKPQVKIVRHEKNMGLHEARWTAIQNATSDYVIACDSDDWVEPNMYEEMWKKQRETGADVVICNLYEHFSETDIREKVQPEISSPHEWLRFSGYKSYGLWNKLIKKEIILNNSLRAVAPLTEDFCVVAKAFYHANAISNINIPLYHWDKSRNDTISSSVFDMSKCLEMKRNIEDVTQYFKNRGFDWGNGEFIYKLGLRNMMLEMSPVPWREWRQTFPEILETFKKDSSFTKPYRVCYCLAQKGFILPLIMLKYLPSRKVCKRKVVYIINKVCFSTFVNGK